MNFQLSSQDEQALTAFLQDLVRTPSLSTQEQAVAERVAAEMRRVGFAEVRTDRLGSVIGRLGSGDRPVLVYNGHLDHVGIGDEASWRRDPFGAVIEQGVLYGRGASDMKAALAAMVYGAKLLVDNHVPLQGTLYVVGVVQEETCEGLAMRAIVEEEGVKPDWVVLGEATNLQIARGHRGRLALRVVTRGRAAHGSVPERGVNAIYQMARLALSIERLNERLRVDPFLGKGTIALTMVSGGREVNVIPDVCTAYLDRRLTVGEDEVRALREVATAAAQEDVLAEVVVLDYAATCYTGAEVRGRKYFPSWTLPEEHPLVQAMAAAVEDELGGRPAIGRWAFSTDGAYTAGQAGIPTVGFGPGEERFAHSVDDQIRLSDVVAAARVYARLAADLLA
jgi:putative selenium metabolism hydrolase